MTEDTPLAGSFEGDTRRALQKRPSPALALPLALAACLISATALAQPAGLPEVELERLSLNPSGQGSLLLGTGELLQNGAYRFSLTGHYENDPLVFFLDGERIGSVVKHRVTGHLTGAYALSNRLEVSAQVPVLFMQSGDDMTARGVGTPRKGLSLGTPYLGLRLGVLSERDADVVDLSIGVQAGLPLGSATALARESSLRALPSIMVGKRFGFLRAGLDAGAMLRPRVALGNESVKDELGDELRLGGVVSTTGEGLRGELDVIASIPFRREGTSVEALAGARMPLSEALEAYALAGVGFGNAPGTPTFRGLLGVAYGSTPPKCVAGGQHTPEQCPDLDDDNDGVKNRVDACPTQGGRVDASGCPLKDTDQDGVLDQDDSCPTVAGEAALKGCPDADKDGIEDAADKCPQVFGLAQFQGCPDTDKDGIEDSADKCPTEAGPAERQGCPVRDTDKDGFVDEQDSCPNEPGIAELKGCPAKDSDNDGVADHRDNCPTEAGPADNQGCPAKQKQQVAIQSGRIELKDTVYFDTAKATIQSRSFKLLDQVASILKAHPELDRVVIEGHTDNQGKPAANMTLSHRRAEAVRNYLINKGVEPQRLEAKGYGQERPIADNKTAKGRATNRRVDFITAPREGTQQ
ncbi:OmpA family protein [Hyalangium minutum]|uniref:Flagellar motor rotation protein MotB n=1 Tax=Hyalangium minutum TaxID=394096 RepID=A0A085WLR8_9BACT|nr:OmpA family protein [Hyalangium minutum]KFE68631.1 Flagellar motor rotation protein MotB [Hyalangium minutum]